MRCSNKYINLAITTVISIFALATNNAYGQQKLEAPSLENNSNDTINTLDQWQVDYGFNEDVNLYGDTTYKLYNKYVDWIPAAGLQLRMRSNNASIMISFDNEHQIEKMLYYALNKKIVKGKVAVIKKDYCTQLYKFKIGDSIDSCLKKLSGLDYKVEQNSAETSVIIHSLLKFKGFKENWYDEYLCSYIFKKNKLFLIEINYLRDVKNKIMRQIELSQSK